MARPVVLDAAAAVYGWLGPGLTDPDEAHGWALLTLVDVLAGMLEPVARVVESRGGRVGWETALDPDAAPAETLAWLAQWPGVVVDPRWSVAATRDAIRDPVSWRRGTPAAVKAAGRRWLPIGTVRLIEREGGDPYKIGVEYYAVQLAEPDLGVLADRHPTLGDVADAYLRLGDIVPAEQRVRDEVAAAIPAWIVYEVRRLDDALLGDVAADFATLGDVDAASADLAAVADHVPYELLEA